MPRECAARPRLPELRFTAPTMYFFSNSFLARSREIPCARSSSMISWSCPSRFTMPLPENQQIEARITSGRGAHLSKGKTEAVVRRHEVRGEWNSLGAESDEAGFHANRFPCFEGATGFGPRPRAPKKRRGAGRLF